MRCALRISMSAVLWLAIAAFAVSLRAQSPAQVLLPMRAVANMDMTTILTEFFSIKRNGDLRVSHLTAPIAMHGAESSVIRPVPGGQLTPSPNVVIGGGLTAGISTTAEAAYRASDYVRQLMSVRCAPFTPPKKGEFETTTEYNERSQRASQQHDEGCKALYREMEERGQQILKTIYTEEVQVGLQYDADQETYSIRPCGFNFNGKWSFRGDVSNPITASSPGIVVVNDNAMNSPYTVRQSGVAGTWFIGIDCSLRVGRAEAPQWRANAEKLRLRLSFRVGAMGPGVRMPVPIYLKELELYFLSFGGTRRTLLRWQAD